MDTSGPEPALVIETLRRGPSEVSEDAFQATGPAVSLELQGLPALLEALEKARAA